MLYTVNNIADISEIWCDSYNSSDIQFRSQTSHIYPKTTLQLLHNIRIYLSHNLQYYSVVKVISELKLGIYKKLFVGVLSFPLISYPVCLGRSNRAQWVLLWLIYLLLLRTGQLDNWISYLRLTEDTSHTDKISYLPWLADLNFPGCFRNVQILI